MAARRDFKISLVKIHMILPNQFIMKISPEGEKKRTSKLLAIGCSTGALLIYDLEKFKVQKKLAIFNNPVVGIEWYTKNALIIWSHSQANSASNFQSVDTLSSGTISAAGSKQVLVKNEIILIDIRTGFDWIIRFHLFRSLIHFPLLGQSANLRKGQEEESIITSIKVSPLRFVYQVHFLIAIFALSTNINS